MATTTTKSIAPKSYAPSDSTIHISLKEALILYTNFFKAIESADIGYLDADNKVSHFNDCLTRWRLPIERKELESLLWASIMLEEEAKSGSRRAVGFWHPDGQKLNTFISKLLHYETLHKYFDKVYCFMRAKRPRKGTPRNMLVAREGEEEKENV
jgi:hypothetical protein